MRVTTDVVASPRADVLPNIVSEGHRWVTVRTSLRGLAESSAIGKKVAKLVKKKKSATVRSTRIR